jgi:uncharacterized protein (DUF736 family)
LALNIKNVVIKPVARTSGRGPACRARSRARRMGADVMKARRDGKANVSVKLNDLSFAQPVNVALIPSDEGY